MVKVGLIYSALLLLLSPSTGVWAADSRQLRNDGPSGVNRRNSEELHGRRESRRRMISREDRHVENYLDQRAAVITPSASTTTEGRPLSNRQELPSGKSSTGPSPPGPPGLPPPALLPDPAVSSSLVSSASSALVAASSSFSVTLSSVSARSSADVAAASAAGSAAGSSAAVAALSSSINAANSAAAQATSQIASISASISASAAAATSSIAASLAASASSAIAEVQASASRSLQQASPASSATAPNENSTTATTEGSVISTTLLAVILVSTIIGTILATLLFAYLVFLYRRRMSRQPYGGTPSPTSMNSESALRTDMMNGGRALHDEKQAIISPTQTHPAGAYSERPSPRLTRRTNAFDEQPLSGGDTAGFSFAALEGLSPSGTETDDSSDSHAPLRLQLARQQSLNGGNNLRVVTVGNQSRKAAAENAATLGLGTPRVAESARAVSQATTSSSSALPDRVAAPPMPIQTRAPEAGFPVSWGSWNSGPQGEILSPSHVAFLLAQPQQASPPKQYGFQPSASQRRRSVSPIDAGYPISPVAFRGATVSPISPPPSQPLPSLPEPQIQLPKPRKRAPVPAPLQRYLPEARAQMSPPSASFQPTPRQATFSLFPKVDAMGSPPSDVEVNRRLASMHRRQASSVSYWPGAGTSLPSTPRDMDRDTEANRRSGWPMENYR